MKLKVNLAKKVLIFYSIITPLIVFASAYNFIWGVMLHQTPTIRLGVFSLFGFIILPLLLISTYLRNKCTITTDGMRIGKVEYGFTDYDFHIVTKEIPLKDRPIFSIFKKKYDDLVIKKIGTNQTIFEKDLDVFQRDIENIKNAFPEGKIKLTQ